jgi:amidase
MGGAPGDREVAPPPSCSFSEAARTRPERLRVAVSLQPLFPTRLDEEVRRAIHETAELLRSLGHRVERRDPRYGAVACSFFPRFIRGIHDDAARMAKPGRLERRTRDLARLGGLLPPSVVARTRVAARSHAARINALFEDFDVLLMPVAAAQPPVELGRWEGLGPVRTLVGMGRVYPFTWVWNTTGQPAASVPAGLSAEGLPLSVQLVGRPNDEITLISLAAEIESERPWAHLRPPDTG